MAKRVLQSYQLRSAHHAQLRSLIVLCYRWGINSNQRLDLLNITHTDILQSLKKSLSEKSGGKIPPTHEGWKEVDSIVLKCFQITQ